MKVNNVLVSQPRPAVIEKAPFYELSKKHKVEIDYLPFIRIEGISLKEFRSQRVDILAHTAVIFTSRTTIDNFFRICEESRITVPETMKYICQTEAVALYLQKYIVYRKRKISFADGSFTNFIELIIKHKDEKFILTLSEPHKPELPEALTKLKMQFDPVILARTVASDLSHLDIKKFGLLALYSPSDVKAITEQFDINDLPAVATLRRRDTAGSRSRRHQGQGDGSDPRNSLHGQGGGHLPDPHRQGRGGRGRSRHGQQPERGVPPHPAEQTGQEEPRTPYARCREDRKKIK